MSVNDILNTWQDEAILFRPERVSLDDLETTSRVIELRMSQKDLADYKEAFAKGYKVTHRQLDIKLRWLLKQNTRSRVVFGSPSTLSYIHEQLDKRQHPHRVDTAVNFNILLTDRYHAAEMYVWFDIPPIANFLKYQNGYILMVHDTYDAVLLSKNMQNHYVPAEFLPDDVIKGEGFLDRIERLAKEPDVRPYTIRYACESAFRQEILRKQLHLQCDPKHFRCFEKAPWNTHYIPIEAIRRVMLGGSRAQETVEAWGLKEAEILAACTQNLERTTANRACGHDRQQILEAWKGHRNTPALEEALTIRYAIPIPAHVKVPRLKVSLDRAIHIEGFIHTLSIAIKEWALKEEEEQRVKSKG